MTVVAPPTFRFNPLLPEVIADPYPVYDELRSRDPVHQGANGAWYLTRYDDALMILRDPRFGRDGADSRLLAWLGPGPLYESFRRWILFWDPPDHTRVRTLITKAFTPRAASQLRPRITEIVSDLLTQHQHRGRMDIIAHLARPLPVLVICELLGVPPDDGPQLNAWSDTLAAALELSLASPEVVAAANEGAQELTEYFRALVTKRREDLRDDLLSALIVAEERDGRLSEDELIATCVMLLFGGHETTINLIGNGLLALLRHPDQLRRLRDDPGLGQSAIDELLRYDGPVQRTGRIAKEDLVIGGTHICRGETVTAVLGAANRDPSRFLDPNRLDVGRRDNHHLTFGGGIHYCVGAPLARLEAEIALTAVVRRLPGLELETEALEWQESRSNLRGLKALLVAWAPR